MDFVEGGVGGGDEPSGEGPGPVPTGAGAANAAVEEEIEDEVFRQVGRLADEEVNDFKSRRTQSRNEPMQGGSNNDGGVIGGKSVCGGGEDDGAPEQCRPPGVEPRGKDGFGRDALADLIEGGSGARIAPGFGRGH